MHVHPLIHTELSRQRGFELRDAGRSCSHVARMPDLSGGPIGATRRRALARLRRDGELRSFATSPERVPA